MTEKVIFIHIHQNQIRPILSELSLKSRGAPVVHTLTVLSFSAGLSQYEWQKSNLRVNSRLCPHANNCCVTLPNMDFPPTLTL